MEMPIEATLELIRARASDSIGAGDGGDPIVLSNVASVREGVSNRPQNALLMSLCNIQGQKAAREDASSGTVVAPPLYLDLYVLFLANFADIDYREGLQAISRMVEFIRENPSFSSEALPKLDPGIDRVTLELVNLELDALHDLMATIGITYKPSILCRIRLIPATTSSSA
jgi:hypothetical protein